MQKDILNNISLMHNIPLQYKNNRNNTLTIDNMNNYLHIFSLNKSNNDSKRN